MPEKTKEEFTGNGWLSAVVGVPHPDFGEVGLALVVAKPGAQMDGEQVVATLKSQLANFKIPKRWFVLGDAPQYHGQGAEESAAGRA
jgi:acyl-CoA synthetase (AMP-forming)/AMP-acid ligase II